MSDEQIKEAESKIEQAVLEMNLRELRQALGKTQVEVAATADMQQSELSKAERRDNHLLSTLRRYVEALGGELEVIAKFPDKTIKLAGI